MISYTSITSLQWIIYLFSWWFTSNRFALVVRLDRIWTSTWFFFFFMSTVTTVLGMMAVCNLFSKGHLLRNNAGSLKCIYLVYVIFQGVLALLWFVQFIITAAHGYLNISQLYLSLLFTCSQWGLLCFIVGGEAFDELVYDTNGALTNAVYFHNPTQVGQQPMMQGQTQAQVMVGMQGPQPQVNMQQGVLKLQQMKPGVQYMMVSMNQPQMQPAQQQVM